VIGREASTPAASKPVEYFVDDIEIARMLGIHYRTVQQMARDGVIPAYPLVKVSAKPGVSFVPKFMNGCRRG
jgi:hypothetical protein